MDVTQVGLFSDELIRRADAERPNFTVVSADATSSLRLAAFKERYPERVFEMGISEGCALATAFGLSRTGLKVFVVGYGSFLLMRGFEVIRSYIAYHKADVIVLGGMSGLSASHDGVMHQSLEDVALMRAAEGMKIMVPSDELTTRAAARACLDETGPRYVRLVRREVLLPPPEGRMGPVLWRVRDGHDVLLCSYGALLEQAVEAARLLRQRGLNCSVLEVAVVAPVPSREISAAAAAFARVVVVEDHASSGGLGAVVAEALRDSPCEIRRLGAGPSAAGSGEYAAVLAAAGLSAEHIAFAASATHWDDVRPCGEVSPPAVQSISRRDAPGRPVGAP